MADTSRNNGRREVNSSNVNNMQRKRSRKKKLRLKKSVRLTIAALFMVSALIVALIPVQGNGVQAITDYKVPESIDDVLGATPGNFDHGIVNDSDTSITGVDLSNVEYAFPKGSEPYSVNSSISGNTYTYTEIDMSTMDNKTTPVPIYMLVKRSASDTNTNCIKKYLGIEESGSTPVGGAVNLGASVIVSLSDHVPTDVVTYTDKPIPTNKSDVVTTYEETPITATMPNDNTISYQYVELRHKPTTYTYDPETMVMDVSEGEWSNKVYVCKTNGSQNKNQRDVYSIADEAFKGVANIQQMEIPQNIAAIGNRAFEDCTNLSTVKIGVNCKTIGDKAFAGCAKLSNLTFDFSSNLQIIGDGAFSGINASEVILPSSPLAKLGSGAFFRCQNLSNIDFSNTANTGGLEIGCYAFSGCPIRDITLNNVTKIASHDSAGNKINDPASGSYDTSKAQCGIFTRQNDQEDLLSTVTFPDYNTKLPYGTFAGDKNMSYVKFDKNGGQPYDIHTQEEQMEEADEFYEEPDSFYIFGANPLTGPKAYLYAVQNGITYGYINSAGVLTYELTKNGYKYTFEVLNDGECRIIDVEPSSLVAPEENLTIPPKIAQYKVVEIKDKAFEKLDDPKKISIPDSIGTIGNQAFYDCSNLRQVEWYKSTEAPAQISIGDEAFAGNSKLTRIDIRDDNHFLEMANDPEIVSIGKDAFKTGSDDLIIKGKMEVGYPPYDYSLNPDNRFNSTLNTGFITYETGNPENLICKYDPNILNSDGTMGAVSLVSYPTKDTVVTEEGETPKKTINDLINTPINDLSPIEKECLNNFYSIYVPSGITSIENAKGDNSTNEYFRDLDGTTTVTFTDVHEFPDDAFSSFKHNGSGTKLDDIIPSTLENVTFIGDVIDLGKTPFANSSYVKNVTFANEGNWDDASPDNPYYFCEEDIIYKYTGKDGNDRDVVTLEECLPARGNDGTDTHVIPRSDVLYISESAFQNCDGITQVDLSGCTDLREIPKNCFFDDKNLTEVILPDDCDSIGPNAFGVEPGNENFVNVYVPDVEVYIDESAFNNNRARLHSYEDSAAEKFANAHPNVEFDPLVPRVIATFLDYDGTVLSTERINAGVDIPDGPANNPTRQGYTFVGWLPKVGKIYKDTTYVAQYTDDSKTSSSGKPSGSSSSSGSSSGGSSSGSSSSGSSSRSSSSGSSSASSSSDNRPVVVSGAPAPYTGALPGQIIAGDGSAASAGNTNNVSKGNANVTSTVNGIPNNGKMSATVNGSSDNYIVKITDTEEAKNMAQVALLGAFGNLEGIRYVPFDISLYDSTGQQKISPVPDGVSVSITMPIPDDLQIYGGNAKIGSTVNGVLETIQPRFTVIDGVPCMNFTVTHLSPYVVYVDTNNLTEAGIQDNTPKTGDPIHPKWFLCIGLVAISILLFLKNDKTTKKTRTV